MFWEKNDSLSQIYGIVAIFITLLSYWSKNQENIGYVPWPSRAMVPFLALRGDLNDKLASLKWWFRFRVFKRVFYIWCTYTLYYDLSLGICYIERFITKFMANKEVKLKTNILFCCLKILDSCMQLLQKETKRSCNSKSHLSHLILGSFVWFCCSCLGLQALQKNWGEKEKN